MSYYRDNWIVRLVGVMRVEWKDVLGVLGRLRCGSALGKVIRDGLADWG